MYKMMEGPSLTPIQTELVNTHKGAVVKSYGTERLCGMSKTELNASEPLLTCRKRLEDTEIAGRDVLARARCSILSVCWLHGIRHGDGNTVIQAYTWNMGGCCNDVRKAQQGSRLISSGDCSTGVLQFRLLLNLVIGRRSITERRMHS